MGSEDIGRFNISMKNVVFMKVVEAFCKMGNNFPNQRFANSKSLLFCFVDNFAKISFVSVFHENVKVFLRTVKKTLMETDNIGMVQRCQYSDFVGGIVLLVIAKAKTFDFFHGNGFFLVFFCDKEYFSV